MKHLSEITRDLDAFFQLHRFEPDYPFSHLVPSVYEKAGIQLDRRAPEAPREELDRLARRIREAYVALYGQE